MKPGRVKPKPSEASEAEHNPVEVGGEHRDEIAGRGDDEPHRISARGPRPSRGIRPHCAASVAAAPAIMTIAIGCSEPAGARCEPVDDEEADAGQDRGLGMAGDDPGDDPAADPRIVPF